MRLWLALFVDMPDDFKKSLEPLLPNLAFKVRTGDSLVQHIGGKTFPVEGHAHLPAAIKRKITELKKKKRDFFHNRYTSYRYIVQEELNVFRAILDAEIAARRRQIRDLTVSRQEQGTILQQIGPQQTELDLSKEMKELRAGLEVEISELQARKSSLAEERPFIWSIEFAEIFFDRGGFDLSSATRPTCGRRDY